MTSQLLERLVSAEASPMPVVFHFGSMDGFNLKKHLEELSLLTSQLPCGP